MIYWINKIFGLKYYLLPEQALRYLISLVGPLFNHGKPRSEINVEYDLTASTLKKMKLNSEPSFCHEKDNHTNVE
ncbi:MAG: hypothetical protein C0413_00255 [Clostridiales bacterium]|nr:hypothetical protein [Clostridiales bacterium]